ncbi:uncharacterized protein V6R79_012529 [Siganus canaliculatus]
MAAIRSGVTPNCLARCFLRQTGKPSRGSHPQPHIWSHRLLQRSHLHTVVECHSPTTRTLLGCRHRGRFLWVNAVTIRHNSTQIPPEDGSSAASVGEASALPVSPVDSTSTVTQTMAEQIPAEAVTVAASVADVSPPVLQQVADVAPTVAEVLQAAEPTLAELGLAGHTPVGLIQNLLEYMHVDLGLPWWGAIVIGTVVARLAVFPVIVKGQREAAKLNNVLPDMTKLTTRMNEAKQSGNKFECTHLHLLLHRSEKDGLPARAQHADWRPALVSRPDGCRSLLYPAFGRHRNHVLHPGVGCRVWYRQPQPAGHEDRVQDHAFSHPPPHHQLPHGGVYILVHVQLLLAGTSRPAQTPTDQR